MTKPGTSALESWMLTADCLQLFLSFCFSARKKQPLCLQTKAATSESSLSPLSALAPGRAGSRVATYLTKEQIRPEEALLSGSGSPLLVLRAFKGWGDCGGGA